MPFRLLVLVVLVGLVAPSGVTGQRTRKGVALSPLSVPEGFDSLPHAAVLDSLLTALLTSAGYDVLPSTDAGGVWKHLVDSTAGLFSPTTGALDSVKYRAVHTGVLRELLARHGAVYWLRDSLAVAIIPWDVGIARWDGQSERVGPSDRGGTVAVLTLVLAVEDPDGTVVATGRGGLQALFHFQGDCVCAVPRDQILANGKFLRQGVQAALQMLVTSVSTAP